MVALADVLRGWCSHMGARGPLGSRLRGNDVVGCENDVMGGRNDVVGCGNDLMGCGNDVVGGRNGVVGGGNDVVWVVWGEIFLWFE